MRATTASALAFVLAPLGYSGLGCSGGGSLPPCTDCTPSGDAVFALPSPAGATLWTATTMDKVLKEAAPPTGTGAAIQVRAAKNEVEPFQVVVRADGDADVTLSLGAFSGGISPAVELHRVEYVHVTQASDASSLASEWIPDPLVPTTFGATESAKGGENQPFWVTLHIAPDTPAGDYEATLTVTVGGASSDVPVRLHVFDFALPTAIGFDGNWNSSSRCARSCSS